MIRFGVIGTNWITERLIESARGAAQFAVTAVYSRADATAKAFAEKVGISHAYSDLATFAASPEFDAVYIASPNAMHAQQAIACLNHGKHVLCEKPLASNSAELNRMFEAASRSGVLLMEAVMSTMLPGFRAIQDNLHKIGPIRRYFASYCQYSSRYDAYKAGQTLNAFKPELSNGALMDLGVYCLYPLAVLFGKPDSVQANALMLESGVDGEGSLLLKYKDRDAVVMYSKIANSYAPAEIQGENGTIVIDKINMPRKVEIRYRDGSVEELVSVQDRPNMYYEVEAFIELLNEGRTESPTNSRENSAITMAVMDEARRQIGLVFPADAAQ